MILRADAGAHEERRRMKRAARYDDLPARDALKAAAPRCLHRNSSLPLELDALDETFRKDVKVVPEPRRSVEIGQCGGDAVAVDVVLGEWKTAVAELGMAIVKIGDAFFGERVAEGQGESAPI